jgi:hypothetical protein
MPVSNRLSDADANNLLDIILSAAASGFPTTWYFALLTTAPTDDTGAGAVEVTGAGYVRPAVVADLTNFPAAVARLKSAIADIQWPTATADWAAGATQVVGVAMYDALTAGTYRGYGALATAVNVLTGGAPVIAAGAFSMTA